MSLRAVLGLALTCALNGNLFAQGATAPFSLVDNVEGEYVDTHPVPVRPLVLSANELELWAVNTHASVVQHYNSSSGAPAATFAVPRGPVSIARWEDPNDPSDPGRLVVACRGTYALVVLRRSTGQVVTLLEQRDGISAEPGDLLVDPLTHTAFLSCAAPDEVLEIDLITNTVVRRFAIPSKHPTFLCWDAVAPIGNHDVLVAPLHSGNNSGARPDSGNPLNLFAGGPTAQAGGPTIVDFTTMGVGGTQLPDQDLFRLVRSSGAVQAVTKGMGTVQFACGVNPATGQVWQLNTEANNKDPLRQGEAAINGDFIRNRVSLATLPAVGMPPNAPTTVVDLDTLSTPPYNPALTVGQPYALAWAPGGFGLLTGLLTDNVTVLDSSGAFVLEWDVTPGSIPRGIVFSPTYSIAYVYCWGTNKIEAYWITSGIPLIFTLDLGYDPTPANVRAGRTIFYDAANSLHNNASCASCHVDGRIDMITWDLSHLPFDDKGPMVTQTLAGIERMTPFHWRGEQRNNLKDFNGAFVNLLGASSQLSASDFQLFEDFVFSLQNPANPVGHEDRVVADSIQPPQFSFMPPAFSVTGQTNFLNGCEVCHQLPTGTSNDLVFDGALFGEQKPRRQFMKVAPFHEMYRKEQDADRVTPGIDLVPITLPALVGGGVENLLYPLLGSGLAHAGIPQSLNAFIGLFFSAFNQGGADTTGFVHQWDQGIAPAAHRAVLIDAATLAADPTLANVVTIYFPTQATAAGGALHRNCDVVAFGTSTLGGVLTPMRWVFSGGQFWPEDTTQAPQAPGFFVAQATAGLGSNVFVGLPAGMGERFGVDYDGDQLWNIDELAAGTLVFGRDTDGDSFPDGHEVLVGDDPLTPQGSSADTTGPAFLRAVSQFVTTRVTRINVETDEPVKIQIDYNEGIAAKSRVVSTLSKSHSVVLNDLLPSTAGGPTFSYSGRIVATDAAGNSSTTALPSFTTRPFNDGSATTVIGALRWISQAVSIPPGGLGATVGVRVDQKIGGPPALPKPGHVVLARIFRNGVLDPTFLAGGTSRKVTNFDFLSTLGTLAYSGLSGPFLISTTTDAAGNATFDFSLSGLATGDVIKLNIELVAIEHLPTPPPPNFTVTDIRLWSMPDTSATLRQIEMTY
jgi:hypothetical protein